MTRAFVLIRCEIDAVLSTIEAMEDVAAVRHVDPVTGEYDVIAEVEVDEVEELRDIVAGSIHDLFGVEETRTCIAT